jgi:hypothetical protein
MVHPLRTLLYELFVEPLWRAVICSLAGTQPRAGLTRRDPDNNELLPLGFLAASTLKLCPRRMEWFTDKIASCASVGFGI